MRKVIMVAVAVSLILSVQAFAINERAKVGIHVEAHTSRTCTKTFPVIASCQDIVYTLATPDADCFPVFFGLDEYKGFDYGLMWPGTYTCAFTSCSDLTIGGIVSPGDSVSHAWTTCQTDSIAIPGWGWIFDYGLVCVIEHPLPDRIYVGDCADPANLTPLIKATSVACGGIGGTAGQNPCELVPTRPTTWGTIKSLYR